MDASDIDKLVGRLQAITKRRKPLERFPRLADRVVVAFPCHRAVHFTTLDLRDHIDVAVLAGQAHGECGVSFCRLVP